MSLAGPVVDAPSLARGPGFGSADDPCGSASRGSADPDHYLVQLVDQLERLQLEREVWTPSASMELQLERLQEERLQSAACVPPALLQEERLQLERL